MQERPKVGLGVCISNDQGQVLLGKRNSSHGGGDWSFPGGHLEMGETLEGCIRRETLEETGIDLKDIEELGFTNDIYDEHKHYLTINLKAKIASGEVSLMEPDKFERWDWFSLDDLPSPLFMSTKNMIDKFRDVLI